MRLLYSVGNRLGGEGSSRPMTYMHEAFAKAFFADYTVLEVASFPELEGVSCGQHGMGPVYDDVAEAKVMEWAYPPRSPQVPIVFVGSGGAAYKQMGVAQGEPAGCRVVTTWFSSHYAYADRILKEEYGKFGLKGAGVHPYLQFRAKREQEWSDAIIVPSRICADTYPKELQGKIRVAPFGVDLERFRPPPGGRRRDPSEPLNILFPGTNAIRKGLGAILRAWGELDPKRFRLTITGQRTKAGVAGGVRGPPIEEVWCSEEEMFLRYAQADILLSPSLEEGMALAGLEAMACGLPLVVTPQMASPIVGEGSDGFLVPPNDPKKLVEALNAIAGWSESEYRIASAKVRQEAEAYPWSRFQDRVVEIVKEELL